MISPKTLPLKLLLPGLLLSFFMTGACAQEALKPFVLAATFADREMGTVSDEVREKLQSAGFDLVGTYSPYPDAVVLVISSEDLRELSTRSPRGGYGAVLRVSITRNNGRIELAYTNPVYWANANRMQPGADSVAQQLKTALGYQSDFGSGDLSLSKSDLRKYHYTFLMEYFDDPSLLNYFDSHQQAVAVVRKNLVQGVAGAGAVYELPLGSDTDDNQMTLFGVALNGTGPDDCSSDRYIMERIDRDSPRHTAHLPYEILVYGNHVEALYGRFRIAISWPHLPMVASDTGATFFSIMCAPGAIENALIAIAGGHRETSAGQK